MEPEQVRAILDNDEALTSVTQSVFSAIDENGSGKIEKSELKKALTELATAAGISVPSDEQITQALVKLDVDQSGDLDVGEFKTLVRQILESLIE